MYDTLCLIQIILQFILLNNEKLGDLEIHAPPPFSIGIYEPPFIVLLQ